MSENKFNEKNTYMEDAKSQVNEMKEAYETSPVPPEALDRITAGIKKAKREQDISRFFKTAGATVAAAGLGLVILANSSASIANAMEKIPIIGAIANVVTFRNYSDQSGNFEADVDIPQIAGNLETDGNSSKTTDRLGADDSTLQPANNTKDTSKELLGTNKTIKEYADKLIAMYEHDLRESEGEGNYTLNSSYEVVYEDEKMLSIRINSLVIMAGGNEFVKIFHVDKTTGKLLTLSDLLTDSENGQKQISQYIRKQMKKRMEKDENITYFIKSEEKPYGFESISNETNFYLNKNGELVIVFDEYEVAPGFMGVVEFTIPKNIVAVSTANPT